MQCLDPAGPERLPRQFSRKKAQNAQDRIPIFAHFVPLCGKYSEARSLVVSPPHWGFLPRKNRFLIVVQPFGSKFLAVCDDF